MKLKFILPGIPQPKARHRTTKTKRGKALTYDPQREDKITTQWRIKSQCVGEDLVYLSTTRLVSIQILFEMPIPEYKQGKGFESTPHTKKPDVDNLLKYILDCGNGILWKDDSKIYSISAAKVYSETPQTTLVVDYTDKSLSSDIVKLTEMHEPSCCFLKRSFA